MISCSMRKDSFCPVFPINLIQSVRLAHALMETRFNVHFPEEHASKLRRLKHCFSVDYKIGAESIPRIDAFRVNHKQPLTSIGEIERPLIFPHEILNHCRELWAEDREIKVAFAGLVTGERKKVISQFCNLNWPSRGGKLPNLNPIWHRALNRFRNWVGLDPRSRSVEVGELTLWSSRRGRTFPIKAWDDEYYRLLSHSQFVLCPSGDYTWTYRFFESVLCGAIPIVEENCEAYNGFFFYEMGNPVEKLEWSTDIVKRNYDKAAKKLSIKKSKLENEIDKLLAKSVGCQA